MTGGILTSRPPEDRYSRERMEKEAAKDTPVRLSSSSLPAQDKIAAAQVKLFSVL